MIISAEETVALAVTREHTRGFYFFIGATTLDPVSYRRLLSGIVDSRQRRERHADYLEAIVQRRVDAMRHYGGMRRGRVEKELLMLRNALVPG